MTGKSKPNKEKMVYNF